MPRNPSHRIRGDTAGGASFVRYSTMMAVYRAGGARSYAAVPQWQDPVVAGFDPKLAKQVSIETAMGRNTLRERSLAHGRWQKTQYSVDQDQVITLVTSFTIMQCTSFRPSKRFRNPVATVQIKVDNQDLILLSFGRTLTGAFAKNTSKEQIYQIARALPPQ